MSAEIIRLSGTTSDVAAILRAAAVIRRGGLVAFPTETVYGLGANALDDAAVAKIFAAKGRPAGDPLIVHLSNAGEVAAVAASVPDAARVLMAAFWPGPLTLIVERGAAVPLRVTGGGATLAVRVPAHPVAAALIRAAGVPIAAPSANRFSRPSPTTADDVAEDLGDRIDMILDGIAASLRSGGTFTTFQYLNGYPTPLARSFRQAMTGRMGSAPTRRVVWRNIPPAFVLRWRHQ